MTAYTLADIMEIYTGSNGDRTKALYAALEARGPIGTVAVNLFRACKTSERAKLYRGGQRGRGSYRRMAYDTKSWAIDNLAGILIAHGEQLGINWGWGTDSVANQAGGFDQVLYVDTPAGQISFHSPTRGKGPDYPGRWDGERGQAAGRVVKFAAIALGAA